ncbi:hypothetical protein WMY93_033239 [Mugilogobius chulae]|uniref:AAA+ ATPase domain-containing protein n=1 Tax=Mugilogobius chulae TaxID=88201 RepID=A0AAW0MJ67_9GOBI
MPAHLQKCIENSIRTHDGPPVRYQLQLKRVNLDKLPDKQSKLRKFTLGSRNSKYQNRTILLVGATGTGKSTLINALVNYVMGVQFKDKVWFEIIADEKDRPQSDSQTSEISVYEIFGFEGKTVPYSLTIIDTPGYGDTRGKAHDEIVTQKLQNLFTVPDGVAVIDAVGFVLKASENRLDERMACIFNSVTSLFAKDLEKNIVVMMTHSDGGEPTNALQALEDAKIQCARDKNHVPIYFQFNNRQKEEIKAERGVERAASFAFGTTEYGMKDFTDFLGETQPKSLTNTIKVLKERERLTACMQNLEGRVKEVEMKQRAIENNREQLQKHQQEMEKNKKFTINVEETYKDKVDIDGWWDNKAVTCSRCEENCHYPGCTWAWDPSWCEVMKNDYCTSCSGECHVSYHVKENWRYVSKTRIVQQTLDDMKRKYESNKALSDKNQTLQEQMEEDMNNLKQTKNQLLNEAFDRIQQLEKIALNADSVSTFIHLEFLMERMKEEDDQEKLQKLERMKNRMDKRNQAGAKYYKQRS